MEVLVFFRSLVRPAPVMSLSVSASYSSCVITPAASFRRSRAVRWSDASEGAVAFSTFVCAHNARVYVCLFGSVRVNNVC